MDGRSRSLTVALRFSFREMLYEVSGGATAVARIEHDSIRAVTRVRLLSRTGRASQGEKREGEKKKQNPKRLVEVTRVIPYPFSARSESQTPSTVPIGVE